MSPHNNIDTQASDITEREKPQTVEIPKSPGSKQPITLEDTTPNTEIYDTKLQTSNLTINTLLSDIEDSKQINEIITENNFEPVCEDNVPISSTINQTANTIKNINALKSELCKLPLDPCELEYITNNINPLLNVLSELSTISYNLSSSANLLSISPIVHPKKSELKDTIHLSYKINDKCDDIYDVLKKRINFLLRHEE